MNNSVQLSYIGVLEDDSVNSIKNYIGVAYSARSWTWLPNASEHVIYCPNNWEITSLGDKNNTIDHFDKR